MDSHIPFIMAHLLKTLNSNVDKKRGMRGSVVFDECGFLDEEMMSVYAAFAIVK